MANHPATSKDPGREKPTGDDNEFELRLQDFGPIAHASIVPRPLTVFIGPSGAGKTFAAKAWYAFARVGHDFNDALARRDSRFAGYADHVRGIVDRLAKASVPFQRALSEGQPLSDLERDALVGWTKSARDELGKHFSSSGLSASLQLLAADNWRELSRFKAQRDALVEFRRIGLVGQANHDSGFLIWSHLFRLDQDTPAFDLEFARDVQMRWNLMQGEEIPDEHLGEFVAISCLGGLATAFRKQFSAPGHPPILFPAGRTGLVGAAATIAAAAFGGGGRLQTFGDLSEFLPRYVEAGQRSDGPLAEAIRPIEVALHGSEVHVYPESVGIPQLYVDVDGHRVPLARASASVSELAPVTFMLRRLAAPGTLVVLEEPEAHLHASKQIVLAQAIARLVNEGVRFCITTHSEYLVDALGWIVRSTESGLDTTRQLATEERLHSSQVGLYRFSELATGGWTANEVPFSLRQGYDRSEWLDIAGDLFNLHVELSEQQIEARRRAQ